MTGRTKGGLVAGLATLAFYTIGTVTIRLLGLEGRVVWVFWSLLGLLGLGAAWIVYRLVSSTSRSTKREPAPEDVVFDQARRKLRAQEGRGPSRVPVVLLLGPEGSVKTTTVERSGVGADLLAGESLRGDQPVPTEALAVWYGQRTLFVEVGAALQASDERWSRFIRRLQPDRFAAAIGRGEQAPRSVVVCFPCDQFLQPGASRSVPEAAAHLRGRLTELAGALGVQLPVYAVFTKADRLPYFGDYVRNLTDEEAGELLGATLPIRELADPGDHVPRQTETVRIELRRLFESLARRRIGVLDREHEDDVRLGAYEFPREFLKIHDAATDFLVELCRPVQLGVSPFLRGFYFTGVRPIVVRDTGVQQQTHAPSDPPSSATSVFDASQFREAASRPAPATGGGRRVPQWVFLQRLFREVVLADDVARAVTAGGRRVDGLRRALTGAAVAVLLVTALGMTVSYFGNRSLARESLAAVRAAQAAPPGLLTSEEAARLGQLRTLADTLGHLDREGRPLGLRWGLWTGDELHPPLRRVYFDRFEAAMWGPTRSVIRSRLAGLPTEPGTDAEYAAYAATYDDLKAYLTATEYPDRSSSEFLTPVLLSRWLQYPESDAVSDSVARVHFDYFARELPWGNPFDDPADPQLLERARDYLGAFSGDAQLYQSLLGEASADLGEIRFADRYPGSVDLVSNDVTIPGAFTAEGWERVHERLGNLRGLLAREEWVLGEGRSVSDEELEQLATSLRARYRSDFVDGWTDFLGSASVVRFSGTRDATARLTRLSSNQSPLLELLYLASVNTDVDSASVGAVFQPLHHAAPPESAGQPVTDANQQYMQALGRLRSSMDRLAGSSDQEVGAASSAVLNDAAAASQAVDDIARSFGIEGRAAAVGSAVQALLREPADAAERLADSAGPTRIATGLNNAGTGFCSRFDALEGRFPFQPTASAEASPDDVDEVFRPGDGALWQFYDDALTDVIERQGDRYVARAGGQVRISPDFLRFFNQAAAFSEALYRGGQGPSVTFSFRIVTDDALPEATFRVDGRPHTFTRVQPASQAWVWDANTARSAAILGTIDGAEVSLIESDRPGTWALFRLFHLADWTSVGEDRHQLVWSVPGQSFSVSGELLGTSVFRRDFMSGLSCVARVVG